jgi:hypothetical protein
MPDLDLIKQAEQEVRDRRGRFARGRSGQYRRPHGCRDHVNRAARLLLAGDGEALTRKAVEMALAGDPTALRVCLERGVGPYCEGVAEFTMPPIEGPARGRAAGRVPRQRNVAGRRDAGSRIVHLATPREVLL